MTTIESKVYAVYKLYFEWNIRPKDVNYYCPWWAWTSSYTLSNSNSIKSITNRVLCDYTLNLLRSNRIFTMDEVAIQSNDVVKFVRRHQFDSFSERIKNLLKGIFIILISVLKIPFSV
jgi:hypothetical protein